MTDSQKWITEYIRSGSEDAFGELVSRYIDLVYSTAFRLVGGDAHRAEDVVQNVFLDLARSASTMGGEVMLGGWLHRHTCFVAANTMRGERRRQSRERQAVEMNRLLTDSQCDFSAVAPLLDEAINELSEEDRDAILLRFFEQQSFHKIGEAIGRTEDAARMRVNRALEELQSLLQRRGVTSTVGALSLVLSANAVQAAPVGLALTVSGFAAGLAGTALTTASAVTLTKTIAMATMQKTLFATALTALVGFGVFQTRRVSALQEEVARQMREQVVMTEENQQLAEDRDDARRRLASAHAISPPTGGDQSELLRLRGQVTQLNRQLAQLAKPVAAEAKPLQNGERRRLDDFHDAGAKTAEAAFETLVWAARNAPERLVELIHLPDNVRNNPDVLASAGPGLAEIINQVVFNGQTKWQELSLRGGGETKFVEKNADKTNIVFDQVRSYFLIAWDTAGSESENHNNIFFKEFPGEGWRLMLPNLSPSTSTKVSTSQ